MAYELKTHCNTECKSVDYRRVLWNITKNNTIDMLGNSKLNDKGTL